MQAVVVPRVPQSVQNTQACLSKDDGFRVRDTRHSFLRHGNKSAEIALVASVSVNLPRRLLEPLRVCQMPGTRRVDVNPRARKLGEEPTDTPGVIEMNMGHKKVCHPSGLKTKTGQSGENVWHRRVRTYVDKAKIMPGAQNMTRKNTRSDVMRVHNPHSKGVHPRRSWPLPRWEMDIVHRRERRHGRTETRSPRDARRRLAATRIVMTAGVMPGSRDASPTVRGRRSRSRIRASFVSPGSAA